MRKRQRGLGVVTLGLFLAFHRKALPALVVEDGALILIISSGKLLSWKIILINHKTPLFKRYFDAFINLSVI